MKVHMDIQVKRLYGPANDVRSWRPPSAGAATVLPGRAAHSSLFRSLLYSSDLSFSQLLSCTESILAYMIMLGLAVRDASFVGEEVAASASDSQHARKKHRMRHTKSRHGCLSCKSRRVKVSLHSWSASSRVAGATPTPIC